MADGSKVNRRRLLRNLTAFSTVGIAGCLGGDGDSGDDIQDSDGDGVIDSEDYAPNDPEVQEKSDVSGNDTTEEDNTPTETEEETSTETATPEPEPRERLNQPPCTGDHTFKLVEADYENSDVTGISEITIAIENIGNEDVYSVLLTIIHEGRGYNDISTSGVSRAGTRFQIEDIEVPEGYAESASDITIEISGNLGGEYGELVDERPCV